MFRNLLMGSLLASSAVFGQVDKSDILVQVNGLFLTASRDDYNPSLTFNGAENQGGALVAGIDATYMLSTNWGIGPMASFYTYSQENVNPSFRSTYRRQEVTAGAQLRYYFYRKSQFLLHSDLSLYGAIGQAEDRTIGSVDYKDVTEIAGIGSGIDVGVSYFFNSRLYASVELNLVQYRLVDEQSTVNTSTFKQASQYFNVSANFAAAQLSVGVLL